MGEDVIGRPRGVDRYEDPALAERLRASYLASIQLLRSRGHRIEEIDASRALDDVLADVLTRLDGQLDAGR